MTVSLIQAAIVSIVFLRVVIQKVCRSSVCILAGRSEELDAEGSVIRHRVILFGVPLFKVMFARLPI